MQNAEENQMPLTRLGATRLFICLLVLLIVSSGTAQELNPSVRYADAYKKYFDAECPIEASEIKHFVYFARDREAIHDHPLLKHERYTNLFRLYMLLETRIIYIRCIVQAIYLYIY